MRWTLCACNTRSTYECFLICALISSKNTWDTTKKSIYRCACPQWSSLSTIHTLLQRVPHLSSIRLLIQEVALPCEGSHFFVWRCTIASTQPFSLDAAWAISTVEEAIFSSGLSVWEKRSRKRCKRTFLFLGGRTHQTARKHRSRFDSNAAAGKIFMQAGLFIHRRKCLKDMKVPWSQKQNHASKGASFEEELHFLVKKPDTRRWATINWIV